MAAMGSSPWPARFGAPLVIPFIVLALLQLRDAYRLHSFTSNAQVTPKRRPHHQFVPPHVPSLPAI
jgi:hypothetical protein